MKHFFYSRLAISNIKKNAKIYLPYLLTSLFTVTMFYSIHSLSINAGLLKDSNTAIVVLDLGTYVVIIFSIIFLFYINSFMIKRRKKELALYNVLGMEKKHIMVMMFLETLFTSLIAIIGGIIFGIIFSKLMFLILIKLAHLNTSIFFEIPMDTIIKTIIIYSCIFLASYLFNIIQIKLSNPIELIRGSQAGEKEPKTKWLLTIIGIITLGSGYYIAQTIDDPIKAMALFFVAVILVIIGTYCLFTAGSITLLKLLKKNKRLYYQTSHFISVSQMIYRMKQNAVGLASICILCTCILVMTSSTVSLYTGVKDTVQINQDEDYRFTLYNTYKDLPDHNQITKFNQDLKTTLASKGIQLENLVTRTIYDTTLLKKDNKFYTGLGSDGFEFISITAMTLDEYNFSYHQQATLKDNEILLADNSHKLKNTFNLNDTEYIIKENVDKPHFLEESHNEIQRWITVVFKDETTLMNALLNENLIGINPMFNCSIDYADDDISAKAHDITTKTIKDSSFIDDYYLSYASQYQTEITLLEAYGSLFFLGLFLGTLFLMAAILIMYYKQLSEGYEDQKRFEIMQNVGMNNHEVKQIIRSQVLIFFFLPIVVAVIHMAFAYKMIVKMFGYLILSGSNIFIICTVISVLILLIIYTIIYLLTSRTYYQIVKK